MKITIHVEAGSDPITGIFYEADQETLEASDRNDALRRTRLNFCGRRIHVFDENGEKMLMNC